MKQNVYSNFSAQHKQGLLGQIFLTLFVSKVAIQVISQRQTTFNSPILILISVPLDMSPADPISNIKIWFETNFEIGSSQFYNF